MSERNDVDYFHCTDCGTIWCRPKRGDGPIYVVAQPLNPKNPSESGT